MHRQIHLRHRLQPRRSFLAGRMFQKDMHRRSGLQRLQCKSSCHRHGCTPGYRPQEGHVLFPARCNRTGGTLLLVLLVLLLYPPRQYQHRRRRPLQTGAAQAKNVLKRPSCMSAAVSS